MKLKIILIGCVKSSELFLNKLIEIKVDIVGVVTKKESKINSDFVDLSVICREHSIDYFYVENINSEASKDYLYSKKPDLVLCLGWSQLVDQEILAIPQMGCVGFHPAELPHNRGRHPLIWSLVLGLERTASTLFLMDATADTGNILSQEYVDIEYEDDAATLYDKVMKIAVDQLERLLEDFSSYSVHKLQQSVEAGNEWRKRGKEDGRIDWRMSSRGIYNLVRGLTKPYVGAHFVYQNQDYKVWKVKEIVTEEYRNIEPGKIIQVVTKNHFIVKTGENLIEVLMCDDIELKGGEYL